MKFHLPIVVCGLMVLFVLVGQPGAHAEDALTADALVKKAVARGQQDQQGVVPDFNYRKQTVTDQFDSAGKVKEHREKLYEVSYRDGHSHSTLLQVNGHPPSDADLKQQTDNEMSIRQITGEAKRPQGDNRENFLTPEMAARFDFQLLGKTNLNGRDTYQISFRPKNPQLPVHRMVDRLLNQISGMLWIDVDESEVARANVTLRSEVNLLGGLLGSLKKLDYTLERTRVANGVWFSTLSSGDFLGRRLFDPTHIKTRSQSVHFRRIAMDEGTKLAEIDGR
jgi:hypothetical protein